MDEVKAALDAQLHPDGYDVGFKTGAGHTLLHAHIDVIPHLPRREERQPSLATGGERDPLSKHLWPLFASATEIAIVAAFVIGGGAGERLTFPPERAICSG